ncbi:MAG: 50S ribosomal protein L16 [Candidatus Bathyarchaeota archaeon]
MRARNYRKVKGQPYTRKKFMKGFPPPKITKFTMGSAGSDFQYEAKLIAMKQAQIRHNSLEAARIAVNRLLLKDLTEDYCLKILPYPHVILRENKMIFGAHADRISDGMRRSFGRPVGTAARVNVNQTIMIANVNKEGIETAKKALKRGSAKLPIPCKVVVQERGN